MPDTLLAYLWFSLYFGVPIVIGLVVIIFGGKLLIKAYKRLDKALDMPEEGRKGDE